MKNSKTILHAKAVLHHVTKILLGGLTWNSDKNCTRFVRSSKIPSRITRQPLNKDNIIYLFFKMEDEERHTLEIISTIGCSASLLGVALTILTYALLWQRLHKNARTTVPSQVLMNLCVAIGMTDIFAVLAGPAYDNEV